MMRFLRRQAMSKNRRTAFARRFSDARSKITYRVDNLFDLIDAKESDLGPGPYRGIIIEASRKGTGRIFAYIRLVDTNDYQIPTACSTNSNKKSKIYKIMHVPATSKFLDDSTGDFDENEYIQREVEVTFGAGSPNQDGKSREATFSLLPKVTAKIITKNAQFCYVKDDGTTTGKLSAKGYRNTLGTVVLVAGKKVKDAETDRSIAADLPPYTGKPFIKYPIRLAGKRTMFGTSPYGVRISPHPDRDYPVFHNGLDIAANDPAEGETPDQILAAADGTVTWAQLAKGYGNFIIIKHGKTGYETRYAHLHTISVAKEQKVTQGQVIGIAGNTGSSTAGHLHYEMKFKNKFINPLDHPALTMLAEHKNDIEASFTRKEKTNLAKVKAWCDVHYEADIPDRPADWKENKACKRIGYGVATTDPGL